MTPISIAIVDDDPEDVMILSRVLKRMRGYEVDVSGFADFWLAHESLRENSYDLVFIDQNLGPYSGTDLVDLLCGQEYPAPFVMTTGATNDELDELALDAGVMDFICKEDINVSSVRRCVLYARKLHGAMAQLRTAHNAESEASLAKSRFLAMMSHDIRTPLNTILGSAQVLDCIAMDPKHKKLVNNIGVAGRSLTNLLTTILDIARLQSSRMEVRHSEIDIAALQTDALALFHGEIERKRLTITTRDVRPAESLFFSDADRLRQVIINLISNAVQHVPDGGTIALSVEPYHKRVGERGLRWVIDDNGPGIPIGDQERIFEPFEQGSGGPRNYYQGAGLGLSIVRELVELMQGELLLISEFGSGTRFVIELPCLEKRLAA